ncbi:related to benzoate 4-monooxygenase cytochrome P450 [Cephalotrichum gorgonifer]|uniref:Related to benzoate 4-monooxygenase cytochrome P450 n=1 Tax=Cephalotrichum gorgonifer TaxID=2041049 RepID=A0AAE8SW03_9PEZI|nr:related to benzoate 4-monooxygenase cytochrome P450 [Cephalotrichum gorgonifer]
MLPPLTTLLALLPALGLGLLTLKHIYDYARDAKGLRRFPGMTPLAPFTNIPYMYHSSRGERYKVVHEAHKRLGPVVRVGPNSLSFSDVRAVRDIYGHGSPVRKDDFYDLLAGTHRHLADVADRDDHSRKRRVLAAAYSQAGLERWEHIVADRVGALVAQYDRLCDEPDYVPTPHTGPELEREREKGKGEKGKGLDGFINHRGWMGIFAQDAITQIGLSADLHMLETGNDLVTVTDLRGRESTFSYRASLWYSHRLQSCLVWSPGWFKRLVRLTSWHSYWAHDRNFTKMCVHLVRRRVERYLAGEELTDFYTHLLEDRKGNANMYPMGELVAEGSVMLNAGSDTTATALTNVLYWLLKNPAALARLRAELDPVLAAGEGEDEDEPVAAYDRIKHLPYLRACLDESLRLTPPNTMNIPRRTPPGGMWIAGHWIPGMTTVHSPTYNVHRDPEAFPDPEAYRPERWLGEGARELQAHFLAFSAGARGCIGRNITYLEQSVVLASLVRRFEFELLREDWVLRQEEAFTCSPGDMPVRIRRRKVPRRGAE